MIFQEKCFSCYNLLTDKISLSGCLHFLNYWAICELQLFRSLWRHKSIYLSIYLSIFLYIWSVNDYMIILRFPLLCLNSPDCLSSSNPGRSFKQVFQGHSGTLFPSHSGPRWGSNMKYFPALNRYYMAFCISREALQTF